MVENDSHTGACDCSLMCVELQAWRGERTFARLDGLDLKRFEFTTILVDPPRAGPLFFPSRGHFISERPCTHMHLQSQIVKLDFWTRILRRSFI